MLDPALFWEALLLRGVTWYYAGLCPCLSGSPPISNVACCDVCGVSISVGGWVCVFAEEEESEEEERSELKDAAAPRRVPQQQL
eukprot:3402542-Rhodomonas_salina.1